MASFSALIGNFYHFSLIDPGLVLLARETLSLRIPAATTVSSSDSFTLSEFKHQDKRNWRTGYTLEGGSLIQKVKYDREREQRKQKESKFGVRSDLG